MVILFCLSEWNEELKMPIDHLNLLFSILKLLIGLKQLNDI